MDCVFFFFGGGERLQGSIDQKMGRLMTQFFFGRCSFVLHGLCTILIPELTWNYPPHPMDYDGPWYYMILLR